MEDDQFARFKEEVGDLFDETNDLKKFKERLYSEIDNKIGNKGARGNSAKKQRIVEHALRLARIPDKIEPNLWKRLNNYALGGGKSFMALPLYFLCAKLKDFDDASELLDKTLMRYDSGGTFHEVFGWSPKRTLSFNKILEVTDDKSVDTNILAATPSNIITEYFSYERYNNDLHYTSHVVDVMGRSDAQSILRAFLDDDRPFCWLQLAGAGGQGKSRLAFDLITEATNWDAGFISKRSLSDFAAICANWQPTRSTLIVFDDIVGQEYLASIVFRQFISRKSFAHSVRLLLIERQRWDRGAIERPQYSVHGPSKFCSTYGGVSQWFLELCSEISWSDTRIANAKYQNGVIELYGLPENELISLIRGTAKARDEAIAYSDGEIAEGLSVVDGTGRPLFAYMLAKQMFGKTTGTSPNRDQLLTSTLEREQLERWDSEFSDIEHERPVLDGDQSSMRLARLATIVGGFDLYSWKEKNIFKLFGWTMPTDRDIRDAISLVNGPLGTGAPLAGYIPPLEPPLLGQWFVLWAFSSAHIDAETMIQVAWEISPDSVAAFLLRCAENFPYHDQTHRLLNVEPKSVYAQKQLSTISPVIVGGLRSVGVTRCPELLFRYFESYALASSQETALVEYILCKTSGFGCLKDEPGSFRLCQEAERLGYASAVSLLGWFYEHGIGVEANSHRAFRLYESAGNAGNKYAAFHQGRCYQYGIGVDKSFDLALECYEYASKLGHCCGVYKVARHDNNTDYLFNGGFEIQSQEYERAAKLGCACAAFSRSTSFISFEAPFKPEYKAWLHRAAQMGHKRAKELVTQAEASNWGTSFEPLKISKPPPGVKQRTLKPP